MKEGSCLAVCASIHDVISLEKLLKADGHWCEMIPTPRAVSSDCGMSLVCHIETHAALTGIAAVNRVRVAQTYQMLNGELLPLP